MTSRDCPCGSKRPSWIERDARGIPLARVCQKCRHEKLNGYRQEVLVDPNYQCDENIEGGD